MKGLFLKYFRNPTNQISHDLVDEADANENADLASDDAIVTTGKGQASLRSRNDANSEVNAVSGSDASAELHDHEDGDNDNSSDNDGDDTVSSDNSRDEDDGTSDTNDGDDDDVDDQIPEHYTRLP